MCIAAACGASRPGSKEPTTAKEKQLQQARANPDDEPQKAGKKFGAGWKYQGDRDDCFFVLKARCFKTQDAACKAARCASGKTCQTEGAGPAAVSCK